MSARTLDATVLIATYNRARLLGETLEWLARMRVSATLTWEVIVIDNNSRDGTRHVVEQRQPAFPVPLTYLFEARQGRSSALNAGIAAACGRVLVFTDDDVRVQDGWLDAACAPLAATATEQHSSTRVSERATEQHGSTRVSARATEQHGSTRVSERAPEQQGSTVGYTGGPVRPIWEVPPPRWLDLRRGDLWGTIAIQDHGTGVLSYEAARKVPLGANMAVRAEVFDLVGGFRADLGRAGGRVVMGQEVPEWLLRARAAGFTGLYVPAMEVHHHVPSARLTHRYFRKWWFGKGVSRAALDRMQPVTELGLDLRQVPHLLGVPRFMFGTLGRDLFGLAAAVAAGRPADAFRHQMMLWFFAGYATARLRPRNNTVQHGCRVPSTVADGTGSTAPSG